MTYKYVRVHCSMVEIVITRSFSYFVTVAMEIQIEKIVIFEDDDDMLT